MNSTTPHSPASITDTGDPRGHHGHGSRTRRGFPGRRHHHGDFDRESSGRRGRGRGFGRGFGPEGPRGRRARKGDVRAAILSLLAQAPANGYALTQAITEHTNGTWTPSPGSVYPTLAQLVDEGLITPVDTLAPRSDYQLTDTGQTYVNDHADQLAATWTGLADTGPADATDELFQAARKLMGVLRQYASEASDQQQRTAAGKLNDLRRELYRTLAE